MTQRIDELLDVYKNNVDNPSIQQEVLVEIQADLEQLNNQEIRVLLETFSEEDALLIWSRLSDKRADDILVDLPEDLQDLQKDYSHHSQQRLLLHLVLHQQMNILMIQLNPYWT